MRRCCEQFNNWGNTSARISCSRYFFKLHRARKQSHVYEIFKHGSLSSRVESAISPPTTHTRHQNSSSVTERPISCASRRAVCYYFILSPTMTAFLPFHSSLQSTSLPPYSMVYSLYASPFPFLALSLSSSIHKACIEEKRINRGTREWKIYDGYENSRGQCRILSSHRNAPHEFNICRARCVPVWE